MKRFLLLLFVLVVLTAGGGAAVLWSRQNEPFKGYREDEQFVQIEPGTSSRGIGRTLVEKGVIQDPITFRVALWTTQTATHLQAGEYRFDRPMTPSQVVNKIARGDVFVRSITFPEGLTLHEMAAVFAMRGFGSAAAFIDAAKEVSLIKDWDAEAHDLEGYLFPETYPLSRKATAAELVRMMVGRFQTVFGPELKSAAAARGLSVRQAVTLASLVEKETAKAEERPVVAAVYERRLKIGMGLQCDPTVIYALQRAGRYNGNLTRENLSFESPYNTYRYPGLPPGPIASPGRASLEAAVRPADVDYLYFVSRNDGSHVFARDLTEHNRNVTQYQRNGRGH